MMLMLPFRFAPAVIAWAIGSALVMVIVAGFTRGHAAAALVIGAPLFALGIGALVGTVVWRMSRSHPAQAASVLTVLVVAFVVAAVLGGAAVRG